jgi:hypothetical protein
MVHPCRMSHRVMHQGLTVTAIVAVCLTIGSAQAAAPQEPHRAHQCTVNGVDATPGRDVHGTPKNDIILCENDVENIQIWGAGGDDNIRVKGLVVDSSILGGTGKDTIQVSHLFPQHASSVVRGGDGHDTIITGLVFGTAENGANVHGDMGDDKITTGSVLGAPGQYARGGGQVFGNDGSDFISTKTVDLGGRVIGGSENDVIEVRALGPESSGVIQGGPGDDKIGGPDSTELAIGPGWAQVDGGPGTDRCKVKHASTPDRFRSSISNCP